MSCWIGPPSAETGAPGAAPPSVLGRYQLFAKLGSGGQAEVFLAVARGMLGVDKVVVVKRARNGRGQDPMQLGDFLEEARFSLRLNHPNLVHTYEVGEHEGQPFLAMEHIEGLSLRELFDSPRSRSFASAIWLRIIADALGGLAHAHGLRDYDGKPLGIVHRDISPHNILVSYDGVTKVLDFGIAKAGDAADGGAPVGKLAYMAPEQLRGQIDRRSDLFAMGVVLWEMLTGERLRQGSAESLQARLGREPERLLGECLPSVDPELEAMLCRALAHDPDERFQTAQEMRQAIDRYLRRGGQVREHEVSEALCSAFSDERALLHAHIQEAIVGASAREGELPGLTEGANQLGAAVDDVEAEIQAPAESARPAPVSDPPAIPGRRPGHRFPVGPSLGGAVIGMTLALAVVVLVWQVAPRLSPQAASATEGDASRVHAAASAGECRSPLRVRVMFDMSGATRAVGTSAGKGEIDYLRALEQAGGVRGCPIDLDVQDTRYDKATALAVYQQWRARPEWSEVSTIFVQGTPMTQVLGPLVAEDDKVMISGAYAGELAAPRAHAVDVEVPSLSDAFATGRVTLRKTSKGYSHVFFQGTDYTTAARVAAAFVWRQGGQRLAFFTCSTSAFCTDPVDGAKTFLAQLGGTQVGRDLALELEDSPAVVERKVLRFFEEERAQALAHPGYQPVDWIWLGNTSSDTAALGPALAKVRRQLGMRVQVIGNNWAVDESLGASCGALCAGFYVVQPFAPFGDATVRGTKAMLADHAEFRKRDGEPAGAHRTVQYVYGRVAVAAWKIAVERLLASGQPVTGASLRAELERFRDVDVEGFATIGYSPEDHRPQAGAHVARLTEAGALELVGQPVILALQPGWLGW